MTIKPTYEELEQRVKESDEKIIKYKQVQNELRKSEKKYRLISEGTSDLIAKTTFSPKPIYTYLSPSIKLILGYEPEELVGKSGIKFIHPDDRKKLILLLGKYIQLKIKKSLPGNDTNISEIIEYRCKSKSGDWHYLQSTVNIIGDELLFISKDITEQKKAAEHLKDSEERYRILCENAPIGIYYNDFYGKFLYGNKTAEEVIGYKREELVGKNFLKLKMISPKYFAKAAKILALNRLGKSTGPDEFTLTRKNGSAVIVEINTEIITIKKEKVVLGMVNDITARQQAEAALQESEQKSQAVLEANPDPVIVYDIEGKVIYFNPAFTRVFGWSLEERIGKKMGDFVPEENWPETRMMIDKITVSGERFSGLETCRYTKEGNIIPVNISGSFYRDQEGHIAASVINLRDIREQKKIEAQLQQAQKMEAVGTLAGGIAHDFNNILAAIMGYTEIALYSVERETQLYKNLQRVFQAGNRAKNLVKQILTFTRQTEQERKPIQVKLIVNEALKLLRSSLPTTIEINRNIQSDGLVLADPTQIHQILMNLCTNADHAMRETGGTLGVKLESVELDADFTASLPDMKPGAYLNLTVSDTGCGMPPQVRERIFDPFFTTKGVGEGTGMGLSVVHGIAGSYGGTITVDSEPGQGSTFKVYLPIIERREEPQATKEDSVPTGSERILFVDDEPALTNIGKLVLGSLGYNVETRTSSIEALELFKNQPDRFDLVITDMTMPNMTGEDLAQELMGIKPNIPIILCTGFSAKIDEQKASAMGIRAFVLKPIVRQKIATTVRKVLDGR